MVQSALQPAAKAMTTKFDLDALADKVADRLADRLPKPHGEWINLDDVPDEYQIAKTPGWLRDRWLRKPGAPRPAKIANGTYTVKCSEVDAWLESLKEEDQQTILRRDAIVSRRAGRTGRLTLDVPP